MESPAIADAQGIAVVKSAEQGDSNLRRRLRAGWATMRAVFVRALGLSLGRMKRGDAEFH